MSDDVDFNNPKAWGYCKHCRFVVAVDLESGRMLPHDRRKGDWSTERCPGSTRKPTKQPAPEVPEVTLSAESAASGDTASDEV